MKIILKDDVKNVGSMGQVVDVSDGFARNYLIPKGLAVEANIKNIKALEHQKKIIQEKAKKIKIDAQNMCEKLSNIKLTIKAKSGEEGKLFGSVTTKDISDALKKEGFEIDKKKIVIEEPIKRLGEYSVTVKLHPDISTQVKLEVVQE
jgi:large subunit ribosomal protein L9